jgi:hypothetical protein
MASPQRDGHRPDRRHRWFSGGQIGIVPAVDFSSLEQVLVVLSPPSRNDPPAQGARP